jgi:hypothetical protein
MTATSKQMTIQSFALGMNNRSPDFKLRTKDGYFLRDALNVDITSDGTLKRRRGTELKLSGLDARSIWASDDDAFYVDGLTLYRITVNSDGTLSADAITTVMAGHDVSYFTAPEGGTYWTDGSRIERIVGNTSAPLNPPPPALLPTATAGATGMLRAGLYNIVYTAVDAVGHESAASTIVQLAVPDHGHITVSFGATPEYPINVYVGGEGGMVPYLAHQFTGAESVDLDQPPVGRACPTYGMLPMPAGDIVRYFNGRLMVALGNILYLSEPFAPGLYRADRGYIPFQGDITIVEPIQGTRQGTYVVADQTYWFEGDLTKANLVNALPYGAIPGTSQLRADQTLCHWMSVRGLISAGPGGDVKNLQEANVAVTPSSKGATLLRDQNGMKQALTALFGSQTHQQAVASSYMDAEIINGAVV